MPVFILVHSAADENIRLQIEGCAQIALRWRWKERIYSALSPLGDAELVVRVVYDCAVDKRGDAMED